MSQFSVIINAREKDSGGFHVRRLLPYAKQRMIGPFIFFDHLGPAEFPPHHGVDVRPHPHIGLATVTYIFEGQLQHRDSLGNDLVIEPGAINWMTAGHGIVHSERTPLALREQGFKMNAIQLWVALPLEFEAIDPSFAHYAKQSLPEFKLGTAQVRLLIGNILNHRSPVKTHSDLFYFEVRVPKGETFCLPSDGREMAVYVVSGVAQSGEELLGPFTMAVGRTGEDISLLAQEDCCLMFLGGSPVGERWIYWNFIASSPEILEKAKLDWKLGPQPGTRFPPVPTDEAEFIPLPVE